MTTIAGVDVAYDEARNLAIAAIVVLDAADLRPLFESVVRVQISAKYVPGAFAQREAPPILEAAAGLAERPDVWLLDAHGRAHPRRHGLACTIGEALDVPSIGCAKSRLCGTSAPLADGRGSVADIVDGEEVIGRAVRTQTGVAPVFVSVGHRVTLEEACDIVLRAAPRYRIPEPLRAADQRVRLEMRRLS